METQELKTAKSWTSYQDTMLRVLDSFKCPSCFEWGPGHSTQLMGTHPNVNTVDSVEHSERFFKKVTAENKNENVTIFLERDEMLYERKFGNHSPYDFIFVDGRNREACLNHSHYILHPKGIVMLHDAERDKYQYSVNEYKHQFWTDNGNTVTLTDDDEVAERLKGVL